MEIKQDVMDIKAEIGRVKDRAARLETKHTEILESVEGEDVCDLAGSLIGDLLGAEVFSISRDLGKTKGVTDVHERRARLEAFSWAATHATGDMQRKSAALERRARGESSRARADATGKTSALRHLPASAANDEEDHVR